MSESAATFGDHQAKGQRPWYVVQVRPNSYEIAVRNLLRQKFEVFAPYEEGIKRVARRYVTRRNLLFPGYLFVRCDPDGQSWRAINGTLGVSRMIAFRHGSPTEVPGNLIDGLRSRCDEHGKLLAPDSLQPGERVRIVSGPFSDFVATVEKMAAKERIWVLLDVMGVQTRVTLGLQDLQKGG